MYRSQLHTSHILYHQGKHTVLWAAGASWDLGRRQTQGSYPSKWEKAPGNPVDLWTQTKLRCSQKENGEFLASIPSTLRLANPKPLAQPHTDQFHLQFYWTVFKKLKFLVVVIIIIIHNTQTHIHTHLNPFIVATIYDLSTPWIRVNMFTGAARPQGCHLVLELPQCLSAEIKQSQL